jgi:hypothetical protein
VNTELSDPNTRSVKSRRTAQWPRRPRFRRSARASMGLLARGLRAADLASRLDVSPASIHRVEREHHAGRAMTLLVGLALGAVTLDDRAIVGYTTDYRLLRALGRDREPRARGADRGRSGVRWPRFLASDQQRGGLPLGARPGSPRRPGDDADDARALPRAPRRPFPCETRRRRMRGSTVEG